MDSADPGGLAIDRQRPVERIRLGDGRSWVDLSHGVVPDHRALFDELRSEVDWRQAEVWRYERYVEERRLGAALRREQLPAALRQMGLHLESRYRVRFDAPMAILYRDGEDFQGLHSDRNMKWLDETLIAILVLGTPRPFRLRPRRSWTDPAARVDSSEDVDLMPGEGSLLVMGGRSQQDWLHGVPAERTDQPRISITWRWTSRRGRPDTSPGYFDGLHYSDGPRRAGTRTRRSEP